MTPGSLWESITAAGKPRGRLHGPRSAIDLADLSHRTSLGGRLGELEGCSVVLLIRNQLAAALTMLELDGVAARMVLCPPDLAAQHLPGVLRDAAADACVRDAEGLPAPSCCPCPCRGACSTRPSGSCSPPARPARQSSSSTRSRALPARSPGSP